ncbi:hypothetical protein [Nannocystis pusilla]|uniref:hypothetical protein n=1 Tax=Nannocystis pusilla TaxID=889268 RepID=UPI003DA58294
MTDVDVDALILAALQIGRRAYSQAGAGEEQDAEAERERASVERNDGSDGRQSPARDECEEHERRECAEQPEAQRPWLQPADVEEDQADGAGDEEGAGEGDAEGRRGAEAIAQERRDREDGEQREGGQEAGHARRLPSRRPGGLSEREVGGLASRERPRSGDETASRAWCASLHEPVLRDIFTS